MKTIETFYAVELPTRLDPPRSHLATGTQPGPLLHYWHKNAVMFRDDLVANGLKRGRVVKVRVTCEWS
jgi:hypothetical protein